MNALSHVHTHVRLAAAEEHGLAVVRPAAIREAEALVTVEARHGGGRAVIVDTRDGGTVEVTRCGGLVDLHVRDSEGRTVATITRPVRDAALLLAG